MYSKNKKYKKPDLEIVNSLLKHISYNNKDHDDMHFFVGNLHQVNFTKFVKWSDNELNDLLKRNNVDVSLFEKEKQSFEKKTENNQVFHMLVELISKNNNEYKKEIISTIKDKLPLLSKGKISSSIRKYCKLGMIEQSNHPTTNKNILSKGRYWTSYMGRK
jgi:hypothetical protein